MLLPLVLLCWSCGAPGDPMPPLLNIPARTTDLEAVQQGEELILRWTVPSQTTEGFPVKDLARVLVLGADVEGATADPNAFEAGARELATLKEPQPGEKVERHLPLPGAPGKRVALAVKNYSRRDRTEGLSNVVVLEIAPPLPPPRAVTATAQSSAIRLEWSRVEGASGYRIYRGSGEKPEFAFLATAQAPPFADPNFEWNTPYAYFVRAYVEVSSGIAESADSNVAREVPQDRFPPSPPEGLRAVAAETAVELSWNLSPEPDTAGYHVYRRSASAPAARLNPELLAAPAFSDRQVQRQAKYVYTVTAVDDKGNESKPSASLEVMVP